MIENLLRTKRRQDEFKKLMYLHIIIFNKYIYNISRDFLDRERKKSFGSIFIFAFFYKSSYLII